MAKISATNNDRGRRLPGHETYDYHARATEQYARWRLPIANSKRCGSPTDYPPDACNQVVMLMGTGLSLMAAAAAIGVSRATFKRWMDAHQELRDAVSRGKAARVLGLETKMLASNDSAVINACRIALMNAAPEEWRVKPVVDPGETAEDPIRLLAKQISGNAIRPRMPESKVIEREPVAPRAIQPQQNVTIEGKVDVVVPRIHTISRESYESDDGDQ